MPLYTKNGQDVFEIEEEIDPQTGESISDKIAQSKGYHQVINVTKDGQSTFLIPTTQLSDAVKKGYKTTQEADAQKAYKQQLGEDLGATGATALGAAQGLTSGFSDEIGAGIGAGLNKLSRIGSDKDMPLSDIYRSERDKIRLAQEAAHEAHPNYYTGGEIAGGIGSALAVPIPAAKGLQGASLASKVGAGALTGAGVGAVGGAGYSDADLTKGDIKPLAEDIKTGAEYGAVLGGALPVLGKGAQIASKYTKKAILSPNKNEVINDFLNSLKRGNTVDEVVPRETGKIEDTIQSLTDQGVFEGKTNLTKQSLATKAQDNIENLNSQLNDILKDKPVQPDTFDYVNADTLLKGQISPQDRGVVENTLNQIKQEIGNASTLADVNNIKRKIYDKVQSSYSKSELAPEDSVIKQTYSAIAKDLKNNIEDAMELKSTGTVGDTTTNIYKSNVDQTQQIKDLNQKLGANLYLRNQIASHIGDKYSITPSDILGGAAGGLLHVAGLTGALPLEVGVIAKTAWKTTPVKMGAIKVLDTLDSLLNSGQITKQEAAATKMKILTATKDDPNIPTGELLQNQTPAQLRQKIEDNLSKIEQVNKTNPPFDKPSEGGSISEKPTNISDTDQINQHAYQTRKNTQYALKLKETTDDPLLNQIKQDAIKKGSGLKTAPISNYDSVALNPKTGMYERIVQEVETGLPFDQVAKESGTNAYILQSGDIVLPTAPRKRISVMQLKTVDPEQYNRLISPTKPKTNQPQRDQFWNTLADNQKGAVKQDTLSKGKK